MKRILSTITIAALFAAGSLLMADDEPDGQYEQGRAVARISVLNGDVSVRRGDSGDVVAAAINSPLMADDRILTGASSRAEVEPDFANLVRIGPSSEVRFSGLDVNSFQIQVGIGTVTFRVLRQGQAQSELDTPSVAMHPLGPGTYRVNVREDGTSEITVRSGEADIYSSNGSQRLQTGQTMNARGSAADAEFQIVRAIPPDSWDRWNEDRDHYLESAQSPRYVSPDVYGSEDLDQYGQWVTDPDYGNVWAPTVSAGWAPYQSGRWVWEDYYGWTWLSYDSWGWAPYHYGRWFYGSGRWCWYPGALHARHYWSPALVGFFGWGGGFGFSAGFGFGGVGWVPLAPFETLHPWWGRGFYGGYGRGRFNQAIVVNNVNIYNNYRNARVHGGVTGVNTSDFGRHGRFTTLDRGQIQQAGLVRGALPVAPGRESLRVSDRTSSGNFAQSRAQSFATRSQAPRVERFSFDQQQRAMQQFARNDVRRESVQQFSREQSSRDQSSRVESSRGQSSPNGAGNSRSFERTMPNTGSSATSAPRGWGRFGQPNNNVAPQSQAPAARSGDNGASRGWDRFPSMRSNGRDGSAVHISPPIVQERRDSGQERHDYTAPNYNAPRPSFDGNQPRSFDRGNSRSEAPRSYEAPRSTPSPRYESPRSFGAPRSFGGGAERSAPRGNSGGGAPRSFGGSGGGSPRSSGGGGSPRSSGGGGGGHSSGGGHGGHR